jgi:putative oxidoreductase
MRSLMNTKDDTVLTILRLLLGVVFFAHGAQKALGLFGGYGWTGTMGYFTSLGIPAVFGALAILAEFLGGISLILGLFGRIGAAGILVNMLVAIFMIHMANGLFMNWGLALDAAGKMAAGEGYEFHLLAIALTLAIIIKGSGAFSVDRALYVSSSRS